MHYSANMRMKFLHRVVCIYLAWFGIANVANATTTLTFDDLMANADNVVVPNGYGGLQWNNFTLISGAAFPLGSGFRNGMVSSPNVVYDPYGNPASISSTRSFTLTSAYLTAAAQNGLQLEVKGLVGTRLAYDNTYTLSLSAPTFVQFNYTGVNEVDFVRISSLAQDFVMDNLTVSVPEPSAFPLGVLASAVLMILRERAGRAR
jgi:hypothetical protein